MGVPDDWPSRRQLQTEPGLQAGWHFLSIPIASTVGFRRRTSEFGSAPTTFSRPPRLDRVFNNSEVRVT